MKEEILINVTPGEVRAALVDNGVLQEMLVERASKRGLLGNIYTGRIQRVLPGMQAAFVDIGISRTAFLHASDICSGNSQAENVDIRQLVHEGEKLLVQVEKEPIGNKGARLTTSITIPSRYLVMMPGESGHGISSRIEDEAERERLKSILAKISDEDVQDSFIVRTAAEGASEDTLHQDARFLRKSWAIVKERAAASKPGHLVHEDLPLSLRVVRDLVHTEIERIRVDSEACYEELLEFGRTFMPEITSMTELYTGRRPILDMYSIEDEIQKALQRKTELKSGGYLIIDQTEAMTTIDVNTGAYVGRQNQEETVFRTNLEAAVAIARQLRLRNLGGIIILDFIDMATVGHRQQVMQALEAALSADHARTQINEVSSLGLVEMTRKRTRESLEHIMCETCPTCKGSGSIKTPETICYEIFREILRQHRQFSFNELVVIAHVKVVEMLLDEESAGLAELEDLIDKPLRLQSQTQNSQDEFDVVPM